MNDLTLPILVTVTVVLLLWGTYQIFGGISDTKKRLQERLSGEHKGGDEGFDPATFTVVRRKTEISGVSGVLAQLPILGGIAQRLAQIWPNFTLAKFCVLSVGIGVAVGVVVFTLTGTYMFAFTGILLGSFMPLIVLNTKRNKRQRNFQDELPEALDFLSRILRAGHSLSTGLQMMADELPQPLSGEFRRCYDQHSVGQSLEESLKDTAVRVDNPDFGFFVTSILIQRQTGGDLSEVLTNISSMIRQRIRLGQHVRAKTAEGRFTGYILVVFPIILFFISYSLNPNYSQVLLHTTKGIGLLCLAAGMLAMGMFVIRKITTIKV